MAASEQMQAKLPENLVQETETEQLENFGRANFIATGLMIILKSKLEYHAIRSINYWFAEWLWPIYTIPT